MYRQKKLSNNLILCYETVPNELVSLAIGFRVGSKDEVGETKHGIAHFLEHMTFKSTSHRTTEELTESIEFLGVENNAYTSFCNTVYFAEGRIKDFDTIADIMFDSLQNPIFKEDEIERERKVILQELRQSKDDVSSEAQSIKQQLFFKDTVFEYDVIGDEESVKSITRDDLINFWNEKYVANNCVIFIRSNLTLKQITSRLNKYLYNFVDNGTENKLPDIDINWKKCNQYVEADTDLNSISVLYNVFDSRNISESIQVALLNAMLTDGLSSVLMKRLREDLGLVYSVSADNLLINYCGFDSINMMTSGNPAEVLSHLHLTLIDFMSNGITEQRKQRVMNALEVELLRSEEDTCGRNLLALETYLRTGQLYDKRKSDMLKALKKITVKSLQQTARKIFLRDTWVCVGPELKRPSLFCKLIGKLNKWCKK